MRSPGVLAAVAALIGGGLMAATPAQAADNTLVVSINGTGVVSVTASEGMAPFADDEELWIEGREGGYFVTLRGTLTHALTVAPSNCASLGPESVVCAAQGTLEHSAALVNMSKASGVTTTVVPDQVTKTDLTFIGGPGADYVQGGAGDDQISGGGGPDDLFGGPGDDKISGDAGDDNIDGEQGNDSVGGGADNDFVVGGDGFDIMIGGTGVDELDSEDGVADTYVNCDNAPGKGEIAYDEGLDVPYDCPVTFAPTVPLDVNASGGASSITVDWSPPAFDGNSPITKYEIWFTPPASSQNAPKPIQVGGTESSYTLVGAGAGLYYVSMRAVNVIGVSDKTQAIPVTVGSAPSPPQSVSSVYISRGNATLSWVAPADVRDVSYEIALRVKDKRNGKWLAWKTLPARQTNESLDVGDDLRIANGRVYQFRVRALDGKLRASMWTNSEVRFVGNLTAPADGKLVATKTDAGKPGVAASFDLTGLAWTYNVRVTDVLAAYVVDAYYAVSTVYAKPEGTSYSWVFPQGASRSKECSVGARYEDPTGLAKFMWSKVSCPPA